MYFNGLAWSARILSCDGHQAVNTLYTQHLKLLGFSRNATRGEHHTILLAYTASQLTANQYNYREFLFLIFSSERHCSTSYSEDQLHLALSPPLHGPNIPETRLSHAHNLHSGQLSLASQSRYRGPEAEATCHQSRLQKRLRISSL